MVKIAKFMLCVFYTINVKAPRYLPPQNKIERDERTVLNKKRFKRQQYMPNMNFNGILV